MTKLLPLYHYTPDKITEDDDRFGEFIYCSDKWGVKPRRRPSSPATQVYAINISESEIINAGALFYRADAAKLDGLVGELAARLELDDRTVRALIRESKNIWDYEFDNLKISPFDRAEFERDIYHAAAKSAKLLGFTGVRLTNDTNPIRIVGGKERGGFYLINRALAVKA